MVGVGLGVDAAGRWPRHVLLSEGQRMGVVCHTTLQGHFWFVSIRSGCDAPAESAQVVWVPPAVLGPVPACVVQSVFYMRLCQCTVCLTKSAAVAVRANLSRIHQVDGLEHSVLLFRVLWTTRKAAQRDRVQGVGHLVIPVICACCNRFIRS
jgi:hypothetical protein